MTSIRILPEILSNQIAAGEVVERPASVVKELLENAIDAGGNRIHVEIEKGGRSLIRVADNGSGMDRDDALLAIERYATSKVTTESDLSEIRSLGFRGEALPSIAAVSRFRMITRSASSDTGTEILLEGGKIKAVNQTGAPVGTMISAENLFYNTPARRKFLKTVNTEMGHISETIACIALSRPHIRFRLDHNKKTVKDWPCAENPFERVVDVLGGDLENLLYPVKHANSAAGVSGWIADSSVSRSGTSRIYVFVNGRFIRDRGIIYALCEGFRGRLMKGRFPVAVVFVDVPAAEVDVNVHPAKQEVRFLKQRQVIEAVRNAVEKTWFAGRINAFEKRRRPAPPAWEKAEREEKKEKTPRQEHKTDRNRISEPESPYEAGRPGPGPGRAQLFDMDFFSDAVVIGQFKNTYIVCDKSGELVLIDQHAAHERIVYEKLRNIREKAPPGTAQRLLMPETIEFGYRQTPVMEKLLPELNAMGFDIEHFGGETFVIKAVPAELADSQIAPLLTDIAETAENTDTGPDLSVLLDECITVMACHGAVRANQALTAGEMQTLLRQLDNCENPFNCPHGRPTMIRFSIGFLEKSFKRTG